MEVRARIGETPTVIWFAPVAITGTPVLTVRPPSGNVAVNMTPVSDSVTVTTVGHADRPGRDLDVLTLSADGDAALTGSRWGRAILRADDDYPLRVVAVDGATLYLGASLSRKPVIPAGGAPLQYCAWSASIPAAATVTDRRAVALEVLYNVAGPVAIQRRTPGVLHVLADHQTPFCTGLDHHTFTGAMHRYRSALPKTTASFDEAIALAGVSLLGDVRKRLLALPTKPSEDDIADASVLRLAHCYRTAALLAAHDDQQRRSMMGAYSEELNRALALLTIDLDSDGELGGSEKDVEVSAPRPPAITRRSVEPRFLLPSRGGIR